jgi:hypothetical protein
MKKSAESLSMVWQRSSTDMSLLCWKRLSGSQKPGVKVMILIYFRRKIWQKTWRFFAQTTARFLNKLIIKLGVEKSVYFFSENWHKSSKLVIITSTPGMKTFLVSVSCSFLYTLNLTFNYVLYGNALKREII